MPDKNKEIKLKFIVTSDIHGAIFQYDFIEDVLTTSSLSQIFTYIREQRQNKEQEVILLDNGDILQGQPIVYYSNKSILNKDRAQRNHVIAEVMNYMQYDAASIGNHDIEAGHEVYDYLREAFNFPWLSANTVKRATGEPYFQPYTIIERRGVKIAILGLTTPAIPNWLPETFWEGLEFEDMIESARKWAKIIKEREKPDLLVGLFHAGIDFTYNRQSEETFKNENASLLVAQKVDGFDIVMAGHDHQEFNAVVTNEFGNRVLVMNPRSLGKYVAVVEVEMRYDKVQKKYVKKDVTGLNLEMNFCDVDREFENNFRHYIALAKNYVAQPIGVFTRSVSSREALFADSAFVDLIHKIQLEITGADISFTAPLTYDTRIAKGTVYIRDMFKLYKFDNLLYIIELTGKEIKKYLEFSYASWFNTMIDENDHLLRFTTNQKGETVLFGKYYNFSTAAGIKYLVDLRRPDGEKIQIIEMANGQPFDYDRVYRVAINSYRANGGGGHLIEGVALSHDELQQRIIKKYERDIRTLIIEWIKEKKVINPSPTRHWQAVPGLWWRKGRIKSLRQLFSNGGSFHSIGNSSKL